MKRRVEEPIPSSVYTEEYFLSAACEGYEAYVDGEISTTKRRTLQVLDVAPGERVLDVGCGRGEISRELANRGARVVAVDYADAAVVLTSRLLAGRAMVVRADATRLPFADRTFDWLLLADVIEHLHWPSALEALAESGRVLRSRGRGIVHTAPNRWFALAVLPILKRVVGLMGVPEASERLREYELYRDVMHPNELSPLGLRRLLRASGLQGRVWVDRDVLRSSASTWTSGINRSRFWVTLARVASVWPLRLVFGNDIYATVEPS